MLSQLSLRPDLSSLILPGDRWRAVWTWKDSHAARLAAHTPSEDPLYFSLVREPVNEVDPNAILVYDKVGPLGYIHGSIARWLAGPIDRLNVPVIVEGRIWRGPSAVVGISGRNTVLSFLKAATESAAPRTDGEAAQENFGQRGQWILPHAGPAPSHDRYTSKEATNGPHQS